MKSVDLRYSRGSSDSWSGVTSLPRIHVSRDGVELGYWECSAFTGLAWNGSAARPYVGQSPTLLDSVLGTQQVQQHASWRHAWCAGDHWAIWIALMFAAGER